MTQTSDRSSRLAFIADARRHVKQLAAIRLKGSNALGDLILAGVAATRGNTAEAITRLERAAPIFDGCSMKGFAAATWYRLGQLRGADGATLVADAAAWFRAEESSTSTASSAYSRPA